MARENEQKKVPMKRKHSQTKDEVPVSGGSLRTENQNRAESSDSPRRNLIGQPVCGYLSGTFDNGYKLIIQVGIEGPVFQGFVFDPDMCPPVRTDYAETSTRASVPEPKERPIQTVVQSLFKYQHAAAVQPMQQNTTPSTTLLQYLQQNNNAGGQVLLSRGPASREPAQSVQQPVGVLQRNGPAAPTILGLPARQNYGVVQPIKINQPDTTARSVQNNGSGIQAQSVQQPVGVLQRNGPAAPIILALPARQNYGVVQPIKINQPDTTARSVQNNGSGIQALPRYEPVGVLPPALHPRLLSSRTAQRIRRTAPAIPSRGYQRTALPYARNLIPNHDRCSLQSNSRPTALGAATKVAPSNADPIGSSITRPPRSQIENSLTARTEGPTSAFAEGEGVLIITPNSQLTGFSSGNFSANVHSNNTPNVDEILQGARGQLSEPRTPVVKSNTEPEDACLGHPCISTAAAPRASTSHGTPNKCPTCGKVLLDLNL